MIHSQAFVNRDTDAVVHFGDLTAAMARVNDTTFSVRIPPTTSSGMVAVSLAVDTGSVPLGSVTIYGYAGSHTFPDGIGDDAYAWPRDGRAVVMGGTNNGLTFFDLDANTETSFGAVAAGNMHGPGPTYQDSVFVVQSASDSFETWRVLPTPTRLATYPGLAAAWGAAQLGPTQWLEAGKYSIGTPDTCVGIYEPQGILMSPRHDRVVVTALSLSGGGGPACVSATLLDGAPVFEAPGGAVAYVVSQIQNPVAADFSPDGDLLPMIGAIQYRIAPSSRLVLLRSATGEVLADTSLDRYAFAVAFDPLRPLAYVGVNTNGHPTILVLDRNTFQTLGEMEVPDSISRASDCCFSAVIAENNSDDLYLYWGQLGTAWHFTLPPVGAGVRKP